MARPAPSQTLPAWAPLPRADEIRQDDREDEGGLDPLAEAGEQSGGQGSEIHVRRSPALRGPVRERRLRVRAGEILARHSDYGQAPLTCRLKAPWHPGCRTGYASSGSTFSGVDAELGDGAFAAVSAVRSPALASADTAAAAMLGGSISK